MMSWFSSFKQKRDIEFVDTKRMTYHNFPVQRAKDVDTQSYKVQKKNHGKHYMAGCPGMLDYSQLGYIVPAWIDIHIIANKAGVAWYIGGPKRGDRNFEPGRPMEAKFLEGVVEVEDKIEPTAILFPSPWALFANKNISALVMPAMYHSDFLDDLYVVPGVVDYQKFHTMNFICMPKRQCEIHIKAGDPLLHVIPFMNSDITGGFGPGTQEQLDRASNQIPGDDNNYYRKYQAVKKKFDLEKNNENVE